MALVTAGRKLLRQFLTDNDLPDVALARALRVSAPTAHDWLEGKKLPRPEYREAIAKWTHGIVPEESWKTSEHRKLVLAVEPYESAVTLPADDEPSEKAG